MLDSSLSSLRLFLLAVACPPRPVDMQQGHGPNPAANDAGPEKKVPPPRIVYDLGPSSSSHGSHTGASPEYLGGMRLDAADAHLDLEIDPSTGLSASCLHTNGFQYTWKGVRTTYGVKGFGQYYFETKVVKCPTVVMPETPANTQNVCRIGVSLPLSSLFLGKLQSLSSVDMLDCTRHIRITLDSSSFLRYVACPPHGLMHCFSCPTAAFQWRCTCLQLSFASPALRAST